MTAQSVFLARLFGLYCLLVPAAMLAHKDDTLAVVNEMLHSGPSMLILGTVVTGVGLAMVLAHNRWSGGAATVAVTLLGWLTLLKGLVFLVMPLGRIGAFYESLGYQQYYAYFLSFSMLIGAYLTYAGFTEARKPK